MRTDFLGLEAFLAIAERGSFARAAVHLNLSQTALSHRIRKLEDDVGTKLLARTTRRVGLTPVGADLLERSRHLMGALTDSMADLRSRARQEQTNLAVGCLPILATQVLPDLLSAFKDQFPAVRLTIADNSVAEIGQMVSDGALEFGFTSVSANAWDLEVQTIVDEPFILLCRDDDPLAKRPRVQWADLRGRPLVGISRQTANRSLLDSTLGRLGTEMNWQYEVQHLASAAGLVAAGLAVSVLPGLAAGSLRPHQLVSVPLCSPSVSRTLGIVRRHGSTFSPAGATLASMVRQRLTALLA